MKWRRIKGMLLSYFYITKNSLDRLWDIFFWPFIDILIWGFMTYFINKVTELNVINAVLGAIMLWMFIWRGGNDFVVFLLENYWSRNIYHLFVSPLTKLELVVSLAALGVIRSVLSFGVLAIMSFLLYHFNILSLNIGHALLFIGILVLFSWAIGMLVASCIIQFGTRVQILAWGVVWAIQPFSCVFYPLSALPPWAAIIARILPTTQVFEGLRASLAGQPLNYAGLGYAFLEVLLLILVCGLLFFRAIAAAQKKGTLAKPE